MNIRYNGKVPERCSLLVGPRYALVREQFSRLRASTAVRDGNVHRLLIILGGMDANNETAKAIRAIANMEQRPREVDVVIGVQHPARVEIESLCRDYGFHCHVQPQDIASLMAKADLAIGAGGSTSWERCCLALPTVCLTHAANQIPIAKGLEEAGAVVNLGNGSGIRMEEIGATVQELMNSPELITSMSRASSRIVDGLGTERVVECMTKAA
jgi:spore coat polysaccharide biosynthesis predicted glycosyltransferase SpsG